MTTMLRRDNNVMKKVMIASLLALSFATGFTCSKHTPEQPAAEAPAPAQEQMATPPADGAAPAAPAEGAAPAAPAEGQPAGH